MPLADWQPDVAAVGAILRARTKDRSNNELGTFTATTRPTEAQVVALIPEAQGDVASAVGAELPEDRWPAARLVAAIQTALLVELSYFPEQVATGRSPYAELKALYDERLGRLRESAEDAGIDVPGLGAGDPQYAFPPMPIVGWDGGW